MANDKDRSAVDFHQFTSDSEFYKRLNLSTFTTGTLYDLWLNKFSEMSQGRDRYYNLHQLFLSDGDGGSFFYQSPSDPFPIFPNGVGGTTSIQKQAIQHAMSFEAWRFDDNNKGRFELVKRIDEWEWSDPREEITWGPFDYNTLALSEFTGKLVTAGEDGQDPILEDWEIKYRNNDPVSAPFKEDTNLVIINQIIACNDWIRLKEISKPEIQDWDVKDLARREFLDDIKTSRSGCISIPHTIYVDVTPDKADRCPVKEEMTINFFLRDILPETSQGAFFALPSLKKVGMRSDSTGRPYGSKSDGDLTSPDDSKESDKVAAEVDLFYNQYTQSWQSGSKTILAKITKAVGPGAGLEDMESAEAADNAVTLDGLDGNYLQLGTGEAMPITMQNGNPYQWTPNYALPADCRAGDTSKAKVTVYNPDPEKTYAVGKTVLLHEVDGVWMPIEFGSGEDVTFNPVPIFKGRWEFQQFATNAGNFFVYNKLQTSEDSDWYPYHDWVQSSPTNSEKIFHRRYYESDPLNNGSDSDPLKYAGNSVTNRVIIDRIRDGATSHVRQVTGFDYLENVIGGTRGDKRSIDRTLFGVRADNVSLDETSSPENTVYFGAVFPDGYTSTGSDTADESGPQTLGYKERPHNIKAYAMPNTYFSNTTLDDIVIGQGSLLPEDLDADAARSSYIDCFTDSNDLIGDEDSDEDIKNVCLFYDFAKNGATELKHVPADYATHCSPSGTYGRPIINMQNIVKLDSLFDRSLNISCRTGFYTRLHNGNEQEKVRLRSFYNWLHREPKDWDDLRGEGFPVDSSSYSLSAFDWRPIRQNRIQFRPLQAELFGNDHTGVIPAITSPPNYNRDYIYNYMTFKNNDGLPTWSVQSSNRERKLLPTQTVGQGKNQLYAENWGFSRQEQGVSAPSHGLLYNNDYSVSLIGYYDNSDRKPQGIYRGASDSISTNHNRVQNKGGIGGVGVIGAVCTVGAVDRITFTTHNNIGMISYLINKRWYPSWGGNNSDRYDKFGTTDLSVRVYQAHPREDTLYDSRFFAVHHFNPGSMLPDRRDSIGVAKDLYMVVSVDGKAEAFVADTQIVDTDGDSKVDCVTDVSRTSVDTQVPSYVEYQDDCDIKEKWAEADAASELYVPTRQPKSASPTEFNQAYGDEIYKNSVHTYEKTWHRLIPKENWNVDPTRRGKLLPYNSYRTIPQLPHFHFGAADGVTGKIYARSTEMANYDSAFYLTNTLESKDADGNLVRNDVPVTDVDLVLVELGKDYKVGDRFTVEGFTESEVVVLSTGTQGCINGLKFDLATTNGVVNNAEWKKYGTDVDPNVLIDADLSFSGPTRDCDAKNYEIKEVGKITRNTRGAAKLKPYNKFSVNGKGFSAYVTKATLRRLLVTDDKPKIASYNDYSQLSLPSDKRKGGTAGQSYLFGFLPTENMFIDMSAGERIVSVDVNPFPSPSGLYDCFFHFHNDISHTWLNNDNVYSAQNSYDQYIQLDIDPI